VIGGNRNPIREMWVSELSVERTEVTYAMWGEPRCYDEVLIDVVEVGRLDRPVGRGC
jgi:hypothetical protein